MAGNGVSARAGHIARLRRVEGQVHGIGRMIEEGRPCGDVLLQLRAAIQALCRLQDHVLQGHLRECLHAGLGGNGDDRESAVAEIFELLSRYRGP